VGHANGVEDWGADVVSDLLYNFSPMWICAVVVINCNCHMQYDVWDCSSA